MSHGSSSGDKVEPNFTPLLDLVLQLVMFFMLCANFVLDQTNVDIKLPQAIAAKALDPDVTYAIYLNVGEKEFVDPDGQKRKRWVVLLTPADYVKVGGREYDSLDNPQQVKDFLTRRAKEDIAAAGPANKDKGPRSVIILRVHKNCPFEITYGVMKACRQAGYLRVQLRAIRYSGYEGP